MKTFEGTYCIKEFKNHNGYDYPVTIEAEDIAMANAQINLSLDMYVSVNRFYSSKINILTERK